MADGFSVDRAALRETAQGIDGTIGALKGLGLDEEADGGRGLAGLELSGLQAGDVRVQQAFGDFCDRWSRGVRSLAADGRQFASRLGITAEVYADAEDYLTGAILDALGGEPVA